MFVCHNCNFEIMTEIFQPLLVKPFNLKHKRQKGWNRMTRFAAAGWNICVNCASHIWTHRANAHWLLSLLCPCCVPVVSLQGVCRRLRARGHREPLNPERQEEAAGGTTCGNRPVFLLPRRTSRSSSWSGRLEGRTSSVCTLCEMWAAAGSTPLSGVCEAEAKRFSWPFRCGVVTWSCDHLILWSPDPVITRSCDAIVFSFYL